MSHDQFRRDIINTFLNPKEEEKQEVKEKIVATNKEVKAQDLPTSGSLLEQSLKNRGEVLLKEGDEKDEIRKKLTENIDLNIIAGLLR